jgi:oxygen-independent coproporphyrinogen-3 oxidase
MVSQDLESALSYQPDHVSPYFLTVGSHHPLQKGRAPEAEQIEMFSTIETKLSAAGLVRYELSNYARPGAESQHNMLYWTDESYWGIGLSAHSYFRNEGPWGTRFWNPAGVNSYQRQIVSGLPKENRERLEKHQSLTDFCHTSLRLMRGLQVDALQNKFGKGTAELVLGRLRDLNAKGLANTMNGAWSLSAQGRLLSNVVFGELTFLRDEIRETEAV